MTFMQEQTLTKKEVIPPFLSIPKDNITELDK